MALDLTAGRDSSTWLGVVAIRIRASGPAAGRAPALLLGWHVLMDDESDGPHLRFRRGEQLAHRVDETCDRLIVRIDLAFEALEFRSQFPVAGDQVAQIDECERQKLRCCPRPIFKVTNCDLKAADSASLNWNMKSAENRAWLRSTCSMAPAASQLLDF